MAKRISAKLTETLRERAARYERPEFVSGDPLRTVKWLSDELATPDNIEATAFVASTLSFGSIAQFVPKIEFLRNLAGGDMDGWIRKRRFVRALLPYSPDTRFYRFVTYGNMMAFLERYSNLMKHHGTLGAYLRERCGGDGLSAIKTICAAFKDSGSGPLVPADASSACKRLAMFLRWMVRDGSPVDFGIWSGFIDRRTLVMPLDVHVLREAAALGLAEGRNATMSAALRLTGVMRQVFPDDPLKGDFALYGTDLERSATSRRPS